MKKQLLNLGLHPDVVNYAMFPGMTKEKLAEGLRAQHASLEKLGLDVTMCFLDLGETAEKTARAALAQKQWDAVQIGAGVRSPPPHLPLFEKIVNAVHELAPSAKICFNSRPDDTAESFLRWVKPG